MILLILKDGRKFPVIDETGTSAKIVLESKEEFVPVLDLLTEENTETIQYADENGVIATYSHLLLGGVERVLIDGVYYASLRFVQKTETQVQISDLQAENVSLKQSAVANSTAIDEILTVIIPAIMGV